MKRLVIALSGAALAGGMAMTAAPSQAAHCVSPDGTSPGFSYFGTVHVQNSDHAEGEKVHSGTPAASNCNETSGNPSERAPGKIKKNGA